ncbi:MAG: hypothetical protein H6741_19910 [Alphaproteobacteria bacterium]|nr:hypothetical protein [Alphaproteobacteria bacterium]
MPWPSAIRRVAPALLLLGCTPPPTDSPVTPTETDSEAPVDSEAPPVDWSGRALTYVDYWGVHLVDLELDSDARLNNLSGGAVYLSRDSDQLLYATSGAGLRSELVDLEGALIEDFEGTAMGFVGHDFVVTADVDPESLAEGPVYAYQLSERKQTLLYDQEGRDLRWTPHNHSPDALLLVVLDRSDVVPTLVSFEPPTDARVRELDVPGEPVVTTDGRVAWLDERGELWASDGALTQVSRLSLGLGGTSIGPWREPGQVLLAYDSGEGPRVRAYDLTTQDLFPVGPWADTEGFDPAELRVHRELERVAFRVDTRFYLAELDGEAELVAEGFGVISGWDW